MAPSRLARAAQKQLATDVATKECAEHDSASSRRGSNASSVESFAIDVKTENSTSSAAPEPTVKPLSAAPPSEDNSKSHVDPVTLANIRALARVPPAVAACAAAAAVATTTEMFAPTGFLPLPIVAAAAAAQQLTKPQGHQTTLQQPVPINLALKGLELETAPMRTITSPPLQPTPPSLQGPPTLDVKPDVMPIPGRESSRSTESVELPTPTSPPQSIFVGMSPVSYTHSLDPMSPPWDAVESNFGEFALMSCGVDELLASAPALFPPIMPATIDTASGGSKGYGAMSHSSLAHFAA
ncbi:hypothetical protein OIV83_003163 [Microbotryomycetes sp. JL201]|nr:hypothetical protein OIV83_003163 [Microbotryomycetes sp. JL201]